MSRPRNSGRYFSMKLTTAGQAVAMLPSPACLMRFLRHEQGALGCLGHVREAQTPEGGRQPCGAPAVKHGGE